MKPFSIEELLARVRAHLRRVNPAVTGEVRVAEVARMLGGERLSNTSLAHAQEMLAVGADPAPAPRRRKRS